MLPSTSPPISPAPPECELRCTYSRYLLYRTCLPAVLTALDLLAGIPSSRAGRAAATTHNPATHNAARSKRRSRRRHQARDAASADARPPNPCEVPPPLPPSAVCVAINTPLPPGCLGRRKSSNSFSSQNGRNGRPPSERKTSRGTIEKKSSRGSVAKKSSSRGSIQKKSSRGSVESSVRRRGSLGSVRSVVRS